jgi:opacity protein-like surface antigen
MIKRFFSNKSCLAVLVFFTSISYSQTNFYAGLKGGAVFNHYISSENAAESQSDYYQNYSIGISSQLFSSKHFMLMPEIYYIQRNNWNISASYISFTILPAVRIENGCETPYFFAGSRMEILTGKNILYINEYKMKGTNFGFTAGAGLEKQVSNNLRITGELRYSRDFNNFLESMTIGGTRYDYTNSSLDLIVGINFKLGGK